jgi:putative inorganic carbon (HCO3(-)) transporter
MINFPNQSTWKKILIWAIIFLAPTYLIRFSFFGLPTNFLEITIYLSFAIWLILDKKNPRPSVINIYYQLGLVMIFLGLSLSALAGQELRISLGIIKGWFFDPLLVGIMLFREIQTKHEIRQTLKAIYATTFFVGAWSLLYFFSQSLTYDQRLRAFYESPNQLAMFLAPGLIIGLCFFLFANKKSVVILNALFLLPILASLYLTYSYATWGSIIAGLGIVFFITLKKRKLVLLFGFLILTGLLVSTQINNPKMQNYLNPNVNSSLTSRTAIWQSSLKIISDHPLWGIGPGNFQKEYLAYQKFFPPYPEWAVPQPHNLFLAFWLQAGLIGLSGFLIILFFWGRSLLQLTQKGAENRWEAIILLGIFFYFLSHGLVDTPFWKNDLALLMTTAFSLGVILQRSYQEE